MIFCIRKLRIFVVLYMPQMNFSSLATRIFQSMLDAIQRESHQKVSVLCYTNAFQVCLNFQWFMYGKQVFYKNQLRSSQFYCNVNIFTDINTKQFRRLVCPPLIKCKVIMAFKNFSTLLCMSLDKVDYYCSYQVSWFGKTGIC